MIIIIFCITIVKKNKSNFNFPQSLKFTRSLETIRAWP